MRLLLVGIASAMLAVAGSPSQHVIQGDTEVWTGPYTNLPPSNIPGFPAPSEDARVYGLSVVILTDMTGVAAYRVEVDLTLSDGSVVHVDQSCRAYWGFAYVVGVPQKSPVVGISNLVITKQREDAPVAVVLAA